jgi:hypothetical protein
VVVDAALAIATEQGCHVRDHDAYRAKHPGAHESGEYEVSAQHGRDTCIDEIALITACLELSGGTPSSLPVRAESRGFTESAAWASDR